MQLAIISSFITFLLTLNVTYSTFLVLYTKISDSLQFNKRTVDVMAGVTTGDFKRFQVEQKLSILANVILDLVHVVSVAQTGCHVSLSIVLYDNYTKLHKKLC